MNERKYLILFSILVSCILSFSFLVPVSLWSYNEEIQEQEVQLQKFLDDLSGASTMDELFSYVEKGKGMVNYDFLMVLDKENQLKYFTQIPKEAKEVAKFLENQEFGETTAKFRLPSTFEADYIMGKNSGENRIFLGYIVPSIFLLLIHRLPMFFFTSGLGTLILYYALNYGMNKKEEGILQIIQSFPKYIRDEEAKIKTIPGIENFEESIKEESFWIRERLDVLESRLNGLSRMIEQMNEGVLFVNENYGIELHNTSAIKLLGGSVYSNYKGKPIQLLSRESSLLQALNQQFLDKEEKMIRIALGEKYIRIHMNPVYSLEKKLLGIVILIMDETANALVEQERREFTSNITHELKTPLTSIRGYTELLLAGGMNEENQKKFLEIIFKESEKLFDLIDSIIGISRINEKNKREEYRTISINEVIDSILESQSGNIERRQIRVEKNASLDTNIYTHPGLIRELLENLIDNGIIYNKDKGVLKINIQKMPEELKIEIEDSGIGIEYDKQNRVFERFYMVDSSRSQNKNSTGLGLSIVKHNVQILNGKIEMVSEKGVGTKFILTFPHKNASITQ